MVMSVDRSNNIVPFKQFFNFRLFTNIVLIVSLGRLGQQAQFIKQRRMRNDHRRYFCIFA